MAHQEQLDGAEPVAPDGISRRKLIATGATLAAAGVAVGAGGISVLSSTDHPAEAAAAPGAGSGPGAGDPVMVYLKDANSGQFDVFVGDRRSSFADQGMAAQVIKAASSAQ